ncbi:MAG: hypothetical protein R2753_11455 [Chitinophagales bacterium]
MSSILRDAITLVSFNINQPYIAKVLCINKDKPELKCNGKCHLNTNLSENHQDKEETPYSITTEVKQPIISEFKIISIYEKLDVKIINTYNTNDPFIPNSDSISRLFRPPRA